MSNPFKFCNFALAMPFILHIDILDLIFKGILIGIFVSAPMGPVGILCVQRTLNKGRWYGFVTGVGAAVSDIIYALLTGFGMSFFMNLIKNPQTKFILQIVASIVFLIFGIYTFRSKSKRNIHISGTKKSTLTHNAITAFIVTLSNPLIIIMFIALYAQFAFVIPNHPFEMSIGYISIIFGALLWWAGLTWLLSKICSTFDNNIITIINKVIGTIVIIVSVIMFIGTAFNLYTFPTVPPFIH